MKKWWILLVILGVIAGCTEESTNPVDADSASFIYPVEIGNTWEYEVKLFRLNIHGDSSHLVRTDTVTTMVKVEITGTALLPDSTAAYQFREYIISAAGDTTELILYYRNESGGLYLYGFQQSGFFLPKPAPTTSLKNIYRFNRFSALPGVVADSVIFPGDSFQTLQYPLQVGSRWAYFRSPEMPYNADKIVTKSGNLETAAGTFDCFEIQELIDINNDSHLDYDYEVYDYVSASGLVKRIVYISNLELKGENSLDPLNPPVAIYDQEMIFELQHYELK